MSTTSKTRNGHVDHGGRVYLIDRDSVSRSGGLSYGTQRVRTNGERDLSSCNIRHRDQFCDRASWHTSTNGIKTEALENTRMKKAVASRKTVDLPVSMLPIVLPWEHNSPACQPC
jgi:hypothetical protein